VPGKTKQSFQSFKLLEENLKSGVIESFYFFVGTENFLKDQNISRLKKRLHIDPGSINNIVLYPDSPNIADIFQELETQSFFSENKLVTLKNADHLPSSILNQLKEILERDTFEAYIIFISEKFPFRMNTKNIEKIISRTYSFDIPRREFRSYLSLFLKKFGKRMTTSAQSIVLEMYSNLYDLYNNVEKLSHSSDDRDVIDESDLDIITTCAHNVTSFQFVDALASRNINRALEMLQDLLSKGDTFYSLIGLIRIQFLNLLKANQMQKKGMPSSTICQQLRIFPFKRDLFIRQTKNFTSKKLLQNIRTLSYFDYMSKNTSLSPEHLIQMLVIELCTE